MLALTALMGGSVVPDFLGIVAGHLYYFVTVLQPLAAGGRADSHPHAAVCAGAVFLRVRHAAGGVRGAAGAAGVRGGGPPPGSRLSR